jgi:hypothetical protein
VPSGVPAARVTPLLVTARLVTARLVTARLVTALLVTALLATGCAGPSRTDEDFRRKAANTAAAMVAVVETARVTAGAAGSGRLLAPYVAVTLSNAEDDANGIVATFDSVQPPSAAADALRAGLDAALQPAASTLAGLRIAARRGQLDRLPSLAEPLGELSARLERYAEVDR